MLLTMGDTVKPLQLTVADGTVKDPKDEFPYKIRCCCVNPSK